MDDIYLGEYADVIRVPAASLENTAQLPAGANGKPNFARSPLSRSRTPLPQDRFATGTRSGRLRAAYPAQFCFRPFPPIPPAAPPTLFPSPCPTRVQTLPFPS